MISLLAIAVALFLSLGASAYSASLHEPTFWVTGMLALVVLFLTAITVHMPGKLTVTLVTVAALIGWLLPLLVISPF